MTKAPTLGDDDLVKYKKNVEKINQLTKTYMQLYDTYIKEVKKNINKEDISNVNFYPYYVNNDNANTRIDTKFSDNVNEKTCFDSCLNNPNCFYALYSSSGCGIECNPNKCIHYNEKADGIKQVSENKNNLEKCPLEPNEIKNWCERFKDPFANKTIPPMIVRTGDSDWKTLLSQPEPNNNNIQWWNPDPQFYMVNYAPANKISLQFRYFAEYWLNAYNITNGRTSVVCGQGPIGTYAFGIESRPQNDAIKIGSSVHMVGYRGDIGKTFSMTVTGSAQGAVWGTDIYTDDSWISSSAVHAGVLRYGETKILYIKMLPGRSSYAGSNRNSISTYSYGSWPASYEFVSNTGVSYIGSGFGYTMRWNSSDNPSTGGTVDGLRAAEIIKLNKLKSEFKYNFSAYEKKKWDESKVNAMYGKIPPQVPELSTPSWRFLGLHENDTNCKNASILDENFVYSKVTYFNSSYDNPNNGGKTFAKRCYGLVAGAPQNNNELAEQNVKTYSPPSGYTKPGGLEGVILLKKMYKINEEIEALSNEINTSANKLKFPVIESFENYDDMNSSKTFLLHARVKFYIGIFIGLCMMFFIYMVLSSSSSTSLSNGTETSKSIFENKTIDNLAEKFEDIKEATNLL